MSLYRPDRIIIDSAVCEEPITKQICERFPDVKKNIVESFAWHKDEIDVDPMKNPLTHGKKTLHLKYFKGKSVKACPGFSNEVICCNYFTLDLIENCPFECSYCILQAFLNKPVITVHANIDEILDQVKKKVLSHPEKMFRIGTGEHSDSLALDNVLGIKSYVIDFFSKLPNALLELKTKSKNVDHLLDLKHGGKTVISWSVNPRYIVETEEHKTARLEERLEAAMKVSRAGYKVAFHFDPMIYYWDWERGYRDLVDEILRYVPKERISWISLGSLRYISSLKSIVDERFPSSNVFLGEFVPGKDGKMRYLKKIRQRLFRNVQQRIQLLAPEIPTYLCMETSSAWEKTMPFKPKNPLEVESIIVAKQLKTFQMEA